LESERILVTGGAGFIGSHLVERLVAGGREVRVLDSLEPQAHPDGAAYRNDGAEYVEGSVLDAGVVASALDGIDAVVHLAAQVGVGQSMYELERYVADNCRGTAILLEQLLPLRERIGGLVVASSMSIYGEGQYACDGCGTDDAEAARSVERLEARLWEPLCARCGGELRPVLTTERKRIRPESVYAVTKRDQEDLCLVFGRAYGVRTTALRFFNVYGPRQTLANPYTGVAAIFASRLLAGEAPLVFEDGLQTRDFVHVADVARAIELALITETARDAALNIGTGTPTTILDVARVLAAELASSREPEIAERFRHGDIRHCLADPRAAEENLGFRAEIAFAAGMRELAAWLDEESPPFDDRVATSTAELAERGLVL
jgi:dTDP-L-rhamnose 4-epimerase